MKKAQTVKATKKADRETINVASLINDGGLTVSHAAINARVKGYDLAQTLSYFNTDSTVEAVKSVIETRVNKTQFGSSYIATAAGVLGFLTDENKSLFSGDKGKGALNNSGHFTYVSKVYGFTFGTVLVKDTKTLKALHDAGYTGVQVGKTCQVLKSKTIL